MTSNKGIIFQVILFILIFTIWEYLPWNLDLKIQDFFFDFKEGKWFFHDQKLLHFFLYEFPKVLIGLFGVTLLVILISFRKKRMPYKRHIIMQVLLIIITPSVVALLKEKTNVYCPWGIERYGGHSPYVSVLGSYPKEYKELQEKKQVGRGYCFPGGHASGGFALIGLVLLVRRRTHKIAIFFLVMFFSWTLGFYQMLRGAHYFSHIMVTNMLAWTFALILYRLLKIKEVFHECDEK